MAFLDMGNDGIMIIPRKKKKNVEQGIVPMCVDCVHHDEGVGLTRCKCPADWQCAQFLSSGHSCVAEFASDARRNEDMCGTDAKHFKKKGVLG